MNRIHFAVFCTWLALFSANAQVPPANQPTPEASGIVVRQAGNQQALSEHAQSVMFVKSNETDPKAAIANLLITQVGLPLLTMGLSTQMRMWNPYMGETFTKSANLGMGILSGHGTDTRGFEYEMLPGMAAQTVVRPGQAEFVIPMDHYLAPGEAEVQPILVRLEMREKDKARMISARRVLLKEHKKGRFDLKPTVEHQESDVHQEMVDVEVSREEGNVYRMKPKGPLAQGEYAVLIRKQSENGGYTGNVALKAAPPAAGQQAGLSNPPTAQKSRFGGMSMLHRPASPMSLNPLQPEPPQQQVTGFLAWDFRVEP